MDEKGKTSDNSRKLAITNIENNKYLKRKLFSVAKIIDISL